MTQDAADEVKTEAPVAADVPKAEEEAAAAVKEELATAAKAEAPAAEPVAAAASAMDVDGRPAILDAASLEAEVAAAAASLVPSEVSLLLRGRNTKELKVCGRGEESADA